MRGLRRSDKRIAAGLILAAVALSGSVRAADERVAAGGLVNVEGWKTTPSEEFPGRNGGEPGTNGSLYGWFAADLGAGFNLFAQGYIEGGKAADNVTSGPDLDQAYVRYSYTGRTRLVIEAGQITFPMGNFSRRYLPNVNPLIGEPIGYNVKNPLGARVTGWAGMFDYTVAAVDRPWSYGADLPDSGKILRPALEFGVTPTIGLRLGIYGTHGPYIENEPEVDQTVAGFDVRFSRGYFVLNGDFSWSRYEVPGGVAPVHGHDFWVETVYTFSPRVFGALRVESTDEPYPEFEDGEWNAPVPQLFDYEVGIGVRIVPGLQFKVSGRKAHWTVDADEAADYPDSYAFAAQLSYAFDVDSWFRRRD